MAPTREEAIEALDKFSMANDLPTYTELLDMLESTQGERMKSSVSVPIYVALMRAGRTNEATRA